VVGLGWGAPVLLETDNAGRAFDAQVAVDGSGNAVVVWQQTDGTFFNIWTNHYETGVGWGTAELIETTVGHAAFPQVAMDASGNAMAVWYQFDGSRGDIWANRYEIGVGWSTAELIETNNAGIAADAQVTMDGNGNAVVVWYQSNGALYHIWSNRYVMGVGWGTAELLDYNIRGTSVPQVAMDGIGSVVAVWQESDGGSQTSIWANRYVLGVGWGTAQPIEFDSAGSAVAPQVSIDNSGNAVAVWSQSDGIRNNIVVNRYVVGTGWGTAELIESDNAGDAEKPQISMDSSGNALVVWDADGWVEYCCLVQ